MYIFFRRAYRRNNTYILTQLPPDDRWSACMSVACLLADPWRYWKRMLIDGGVWYQFNSPVTEPSKSRVFLLITCMNHRGISIYGTGLRLRYRNATDLDCITEKERQAQSGYPTQYGNHLRTVPPHRQVVSTSPIGTQYRLWVLGAW